MAHYRIVKQEGKSGHNLDGNPQEFSDFYVTLMNEIPIYQNEGFFQIIDHLKGVLCHGDRVTMDVEV